MALLAIGGTLLVLFGMMYCTGKVDAYWGRRAGRVVVHQRRSTPPVFRTSHDQCADCGRENDLLNLDEICRDCFDLKVSRNG
jgi:ribosomal protein S14